MEEEHVTVLLQVSFVKLYPKIIRPKVHNGRRKYIPFVSQTIKYRVMYLLSIETRNYGTEQMEFSVWDKWFQSQHKLNQQLNLEAKYMQELCNLELFCVSVCIVV